jgi:hypothetical protein
VKKFLWLALAACCLLSGTTARLLADEEDSSEMKPLFVVALRSYDELISDLDYVGKLSGQEDLGQGIEGLIELVTQGQGLSGLDESKPWGLAVSTDSVQFQIVGFLPINDLEKFMTAISGIAGEPEKGDDGIWDVELQGQALAFKQEGDWTYFSMSADFLVDLPKDPAKLLNGLHNEYDGAVRIHVQNIPEIFRQLAIEQLKIGLEQGLTSDGLQVPGLDALPGGGQLPGMDALPKLTDEQQQLATAIARAQLDSLSESLNDIDNVTFGLQIDEKSGKFLADVLMVAVAGSKTAEDYKNLSSGKSRFAGFKKFEKSAARGVISMNLNDREIGQAKEAIAAVQEQLNEQIAGINLGDDYIKDLLKGFVEKLMNVGRETVDSGKIDIGLALEGEGPHTLLVGSYIKDDTKATALLDELIETIETEAGFYGFEKNVEEHKGVKFSRVLLPIPPGGEGDMIANLFGSDVELVVGVGEQSAYVAIGTEGIEKLKKAIDASTEAADEKVLPVDVMLSLSPLAELAGQGQDADPNAALVSSALEGTDDSVHITVEPIENGVNLHVEGKEGLLKLIGTMITQMGSGLPQL